MLQSSRLFLKVDTRMRNWVEAMDEVGLCTGCEINLKMVNQWPKDREKMMDFCYKHGLLRKSVRCSNCDSEIFLNDENYYLCEKVQVEKGRRKTKRERCNFRKSGIKKTFFDRSQLKINQILQVVYWFLMGSVSHNEICDQVNISTETLTNWCSFCREILIYWQGEVNNTNEYFDGHLAFTVFKKRYPRTKEAFHQFCISAGKLYPPPK